MHVEKKQDGNEKCIARHVCAVVATFLLLTFQFLSNEFFTDFSILRTFLSIFLAFTNKFFSYRYRNLLKAILLDFSLPILFRTFKIHKRIFCKI